MPKYVPSEDELDEDYRNAPVTEPETPAEGQASVDDEAAETAEILVSKSKLPGEVKEGQTVTFRVKKDFGDEVSLEVAAAAPEAGMDEEEPLSVEGSELAALAGEEEM